MSGSTLQEKNRILMGPAIAILEERKIKIEETIETFTAEPSQDGFDRGDVNPDVKSHDGLLNMHRASYVKITDCLAAIKASRKNGSNFNICQLCGTGRNATGSVLFTPVRMINTYKIGNPNPGDKFPCFECPKVKI